MLWQMWWVWAAAAVALVILETLLPGYVLLGFGIGAGVVSLLTATGADLGLEVLLLIFAVVSLIAWIAMRKIFGQPGDEARRIDHDINDN